MSEGVDAVPVDIGDRAICAHAEVSGHELHADHGAGLERRRIAQARAQAATSGNPLSRLQADGAQLGCEMLDGSPREPGEGERRGDILEPRTSGKYPLPPGEVTGQIRS